MRKFVFGAILLAACGGADQPPPPVPTPLPPPPPVETAAVTTATTVESKPAEAPVRSMAEMQRETINRLEAAFNAHDAKGVASVYSTDATTRVAGPTGMEVTQGREALDKMHADLFAAIPDLKLATLRVFQIGDRAVHEWVTAGTQKNEFHGMKATGKPSGFRAVSIYTFDANGLITKDDTYYDQMTIAIQTGNHKGTARPVPTLTSQKGSFLTSSNSSEETKNLASMKTLYTAMEAKNEKDFMALIADDVVHSNQNKPQDTVGKEAVKKEFVQFTKSFETAKVNIENIWAVGNVVIAQIEISGNNKSHMAKKPKPITFHSVDVVEFKNGKIQTGYGYSSTLEFLGQLGLLSHDNKGPAKKSMTPPPPPPPAAESHGQNK